MTREEDLQRHLHDLVTRTFEGAAAWQERVALFDRAADLLDPVVRAALAEVDEGFLDGTGEVERRRETPADGGSRNTGSCPGRDSGRRSAGTAVRSAPCR